MRAHLEREREALEAGDIGLSASLLGEFRIHLADALGNRLLTDVLRDLTARTTLISMLYQSSDKACESSDDHREIIDAIEDRDFSRAVRLMDEHIPTVEASLDLSVRPDPPAGLHGLLPPVRDDAMPPSGGGEFRETEFNPPPPRRLRRRSRKDKS